MIAHTLYLIRKSSPVRETEQGLVVSLANNSHHLIEFKGDKQPIGVYWEETKFTSHHVNLMDHDTLYVFTDGFVDQFGGEHRKKYKAQRFHS